MIKNMTNFWQNPRVKQLIDVRNIGLYVFSLVVLAIAWSSVKAIENNYQLQRQIANLNQQNSLLHLQNETTYLQNQYLQSDEYLELAARQNLGLAAPGEKVLLVPKDVSMKYVDKSINPSSTSEETKADKTRSKYVKNLEDWRDFLLGRKPTAD